MQIRHVVSATVFLTLSGVVLSGCQYIQQKVTDKVAEQVIERAAEGDVDIDSSDGEYTITTDKGEVKVGSQDISAVKAVVDIPDWITGSAQSGVISSESDGKQAVYATLVSSKSVADTYTYWTDYFKSKGYENVTKSDYSGTKMVSGTMGENSEQSLAITVSESDDDNVDGVMVTIIYSGPAAE